MPKTRQTNRTDYSRDISKGDAKFGFSIMPHLGNGNITFSPYSIRTALAMVYEGAKGETAREISDVAFIPENPDLRRKGYQDLTAQLNARTSEHVLRSANGLWIENNFNINHLYQCFLSEHYGAQTVNADFVGMPEYEREQINRWVSKETEEKIKELFPQGSIGPLTVIALANALYFKGLWENKFDPELTQKQDYTLLDGKRIQVDMMRKGDVERKRLPKFEYGSFDGFQVAMLPYKGYELAKVVMLPSKNLSVSQLENLLQENPNSLGSWTRQLRKTEFARLEIPKHEIRSGFSLNMPLQRLGINRMFDFGTADLSGIGEGKLYISDGYHQAYFKTDEKGSEGAAATGFVARTLGIIEKPKPVEFVADRPFLELIVHRPTDAILFLNRIVDPR